MGKRLTIRQLKGFAESYGMPHQNRSESELREMLTIHRCSECGREFLDGYKGIEFCSKACQMNSQDD
jgi:hypothetical protein